MQFDYFYGNEAEQFTFYRIPKILITSPHFKKISDSAKLLYGLMLDRMSLSIRNGWLDDDNRAYIFFTTNDVMEQMCCGTEKATKMLAELDSEKGIGLIERVKQSLIDRKVEREDVNEICVNATETAHNIGNKSLANMVMLGAVLKKTELFTIDEIEYTMKKSLPENKHKLIEMNIKAVKEGYNLV